MKTIEEFKQANNFSLLLNLNTKRKLLSPVLVVILAVFFLLGCEKNNLQIDATGAQVSDMTFDNKVISNVVYGKNTDWLGRKQILALDFYMPFSGLTKDKFPLIVFFHGGGYNTGSKETVKSQCEILASSGFVVAAAEYRIGWTQDEIYKCNSNIPESIEAFYRAQQDARATMRFLVANANIYSIDPEWIFVAGQSAGAGISLALKYWNQDSINYYIPGMADTLGPLNTSGNNLRNTYNIKGIGSMWGGLEYSLDIITKDNATPAIFFHGLLDDTVPWNIGNLYNCDSFPKEYGSKPLYKKLVSYGVPSVIHIDSTGGHGIYDEQFNMENIACFFKSIISKQPQTGYYTNKVTNCK